MPHPHATPTQAHLAARASSARQKSSADELHKKLDSIKQDVKEAVADSSRGLYKELHKATAGWVSAPVRVCGVFAPCPPRRAQHKVVHVSRRCSQLSRS